MKTAIIILNYNDYKTTINMLNQIKDYKVLDYILVVDNKSIDESYLKLKEYENKRIKVIQTDENKGYAYGNNFGLRYLEDKNIDNVIISNPDIIVEEETIKKLIKDLKENKDISIISPTIKQNGEVLRGWKFPRYIDELLSNINYVQRIAKKKMLYDDNHYTNDLSKVDVVSGCFFMIRYDDFKEINYFDEGTFLYYEENIIAKKLKEKNKNIYVDNTVNIIHNESVSVNKSINSIKKYKILKQSQKYYQMKYCNINLFNLLILRITYYISLFVSYILYFISKLKK